MDELIYYLAYGSNIAPQRLADRDIKVSPRERGILRGYQLVFNIKDQFHPEIGYANIERGNAHVEAALYQLDQSNLAKLAKYEQEYDQIEIEAHKENGALIQAVTYIGKREWIGNNLKPSSWYLDYFLSHSEFFSKEYLDWLRSIEAIEQAEDKHLDGKY